MTGDIENTSPERGGGVFTALKGMFSFFTILPINIEMKEIDAMNRMFWLVPIIGLFYGLLAAGEVWLLSNVMDSALLIAVVTLFTMHLFNRYLHLDGLLDVGDGLTVAGTVEDHRRALKDSTIGSGAFATGFFVTLITIVSMSQLGIGMPLWVSFVLLFAMSEVFCRNAQVFAAGFGIPSNGMAGESVRCTGRREMICSLILTVCIVAALELATCTLLGHDAYDYTFIPVCTAAGLLASVVWARILSGTANRNFGAVNGDILGAVNESTRAIVLLLFVAILTVML
ncbi:MAG: adenosylcobinamide-GDP ribazoletransferase [Candidatus Methanomethylophilaceae archaeon]